MRLNWFLPAPGKADRGNVPARPGLVRRGLKRIGPTWAASPLRRCVQIGSFATFVWLLCYVCWPYTARPARAWHGWLPVEVDGATGKVTVEVEQQPVEPVKRDALLYVADPGAADDPYLGSFRVESIDDRQLELVPAEPLTPPDLDRLSASFGPWSLSEAPPGAWPSHYADGLKAKERIPAEGFLALDPLVSISTAVAGRCWVGSLVSAGAILLICILIPRGFCAYVCPMGTLIDLFDWAIGRRVTLFRVPARGWWVHLKHYLLLAVLAASLFGVLISGFVAAIPVVTRAMAFMITPLQMGIVRGWHQVPPMHAGHYVSIALFLVVLGLGLFRPRFWCSCVCPSGAVFSIGNLLRLSERKVESSCIGCKRCVEICPFDAIRPDFTTRTTECTFCQACGGVCPARSIKFVGRFDSRNLKAAVSEPPAGETSAGRRRFLCRAAGTAAAVAGGAGAALATGAWSASLGAGGARAIVRPPGSVPETEFLRLCIRCGECFQACPNNVLQPVGFDRGPEGLWTPQVVADWSGCEPSCANCGRVCPTGAIRPLSLEEKRVARMGLAMVNEQTCLPYAGREACQLCVDECATAGYDAIEFRRVGTETDRFGTPIEGSGFLAPVVVAEKCVGCGLCQTRCYAMNCKGNGPLEESAIRVRAGEAEARTRRQQQRQRSGPGGAGDRYLPDFLK